MKRTVCASTGLAIRRQPFQQEARYMFSMQIRKDNFPPSIPALLLTLNPDPLEGRFSPHGEREASRGGNAASQQSKAEQKEWGSHGQGLINEPLI